MDNASHIHQRGFTLLEALVALVVISIGLLGVLGLQTVSIANTQVSASRTKATLAADNIADRMRANRPGARAGEYDGVAHPYDPDDTPPDPCTTGNTCDFAAMAERDVWEWDKQIGSALPSGQGHIACDKKEGGECVSYTVTVLWSEREATGSNGLNSGDLCDDDPDTFQDRCFITEVRP